MITRVYKGDRHPFVHRCVIVLTLLACFGANGCTYFRQSKQQIWSYLNDTCKTHAYTQFILSDYLTKRFDKKAPVRAAIVPFSVPANLASISNEQPGIGNQMAWQIHANLLRTGQIPIVEVFNRQDWPRKKEEFYTGNFGAISLADEAGYDLVLVGLVKSMRYQGAMVADAKLIEVTTGITVWYGESTVETDAPQYERDQLREDFTGDYITRKPSALVTNQLVDQMAHCMVENILSEDPVPE